MMTEFHVKGYKSLADVKIPLTPIHVLIGENDSGKTSVLEAMLALSRTTSRPLDEAFSGEWKGHDLVFHSHVDREIELSATFDESESVYKLRVEFPNEEKNCQIISEWIDDDNFSSPGIPFSAVFSRIHVELQHRKQLEKVANQIGVVQYYRFDAKMMSLPAAIDANRRFRMDSDGFGLPTLLDDLITYEPELFIKLREEFCLLFPQFRRVRLETRMAANRTFAENGLHQMSNQMGKSIVFESRNGKEVPAQQASDGALLFLGFLALMHLPDPPKLLLIEEPEKGVYPKRLEQIVRLLKNYSSRVALGKSPQIILTTHSPYLISDFKPEEVTLMRREPDGSSRAYPLRDSELIRENVPGFYLGEVWFNFTEDQIVGNAEYARLH